MVLCDDAEEVRHNRELGGIASQLVTTGITNHFWYMRIGLRCYRETINSQPMAYFVYREGICVC